MTTNINRQVAQELLLRRGKSHVKQILQKVRDAFEESKIKTRAGYEKTTMGGHLPDGMHAKPAPTKVQWLGEKK